jgi:hypothetical protein
LSPKNNIKTSNTILGVNDSRLQRGEVNHFYFFIDSVTMRPKNFPRGRKLEGKSDYIHPIRTGLQTGTRKCAEPTRR